MKDDEIVRRAITTAFCMEFETYMEVFGYNRVYQREYAKTKFEMMGRNFGAWFCDLDSGNSRLFMNYCMNNR